MAEYVFYPQMPSGISTTFEAFRCESDDEALAKAETVLDRHSTAVFVMVWEGERVVGHVGSLGAPVQSDLMPRA